MQMCTERFQKEAGAAGVCKSNLHEKVGVGAEWSHRHRASPGGRSAGVKVPKSCHRMAEIADLRQSRLSPSVCREV